MFQGESRESMCKGPGVGENTTCQETKEAGVTRHRMRLSTEGEFGRKLFLLRAGGV